jgi:molecular chaperone GrpE (heat shock protein)
MDRVLKKYEVIVPHIGDIFDLELHKAFDRVIVKEKEQEGRVVGIIEYGLRHEGQIVKWPLVEAGVVS